MSKRIHSSQHLESKINEKPSSMYRCFVKFSVQKQPQPPVAVVPVTISVFAGIAYYFQNRPRYTNLIFILNVTIFKYNNINVILFIIFMLV